jgi:P27 family predicted phage terminase small subunit
MADASTVKIPRAPKGLSAEGKALWKTMHQEFDFTGEPQKLAILEQACRVLDTITKLEEEAESGPLTVRGSQGQQVINPLVAEARFQRGLLAQLMTKLGLPDADPEKAEKQMKRSDAARKAAQARWHG